MSNQGGRPGGGGDAAMGAASSATSEALSMEPAVGEKRKAPAGVGPDTVVTTAAEASTSSTSRKRSKKRPWTAEEDANLMEAVHAARSEQEESSGGSNPEVTDEEDGDDWDDIAQSVPDRTAVQCLQRYLHLEKKRKGSVCLRTHALNSLNHHSPITFSIFICLFLTRHSCFFATFRFIKFRRALVTKKLLVVPRTLRTRQSRQLSRKPHGPWKTLQSFDDSSRDIHTAVSK